MLVIFGWFYISWKTSTSVGESLSPCSPCVLFFSFGVCLAILDLIVLVIRVVTFYPINFTENWQKCKNILKSNAKWAEGQGEGHDPVTIR